METKSHNVAFIPNLRKWKQYYNAVTNNKEATVTFPRYAKLLPQYVKAKVACTSTIDSTKLNNSKVERTKECQEAFNIIKREVSREALLNFPDFSREFHVYTVASNYQLGAVIMQEDRLLAFYGCKLNKAPKTTPLESKNSLA